MVPNLKPKFDHTNSQPLSPLMVNSAKIENSSIFAGQIVAKIDITQINWKKVEMIKKSVNTSRLEFDSISFIKKNFAPLKCSWFYSNCNSSANIQRYLLKILALHIFKNIKQTLIWTPSTIYIKRLYPLILWMYEFELIEFDWLQTK